jgi:hypothetical protein
MKQLFTFLSATALALVAQHAAAQARVEPNQNAPYNLNYIAGYVNNAPGQPAHNFALQDFSGAPLQYPSLLKVMRSGRVGLNLADADPECWFSVGRGMASISVDDIGGTFPQASLSNPLVPNGGASIGFNATRQAAYDGAFRLELRNNKSGGSVVWADNEGALSFSTIGSWDGHTNWVSSQAVATTYCRLKILADGKVQVGRGLITASPHYANYKMAVDGKLVAQSVYVLNSTDWADFVFEPAYQLLPLPELERYLQVNRHLPTIPSAQEVQANGIDIGTMQARLLQQVEELTLRVIELDKQNRRLQAKMAALAAGK